MTDAATAADDRRFMRRALALAERGWGRVQPNPLVGAVVVRAGEAVGEGYHAEYGGPHAEAAALEAAGERARGATLYVTLEPCAHHGKTPPCTKAIFEAGVTRVVYAAADPSAEAGGGADALREAGVAVVGGVERDAALRQNAPFFHAITRGGPYVALKFGLSLDARIAAGPGRTTAVTGDAARTEVHRLRAGFDAVLIGSATARVDDPLLTVRLGGEPRRPPVRAVVDTEAMLRLDSRLVRTVGAAPVTVLCAEDADDGRVGALERAGVSVSRAARAPGGVDIGAALDALWADGIRSVLCEGGGRLAASLLAAGRVERLYLFYAARLLGEGGVAAFPAGTPPPAEWRLSSAREVGGDALLVLDRRTAEPPGETPGPLAGYDA